MDLKEFFRHRINPAKPFIDSFGGIHMSLDLSNKVSPAVLVLLLFPHFPG
jgi:hypothetical protein